ncbi:phage tail protein [Dickeya dadantii]|uniref:phage tail protein n=1 Tax=Dickeya dadantii TaxID=204038 RepID=UPI0003A3F535|nr:phage tail protein [Dickeya dadantii]
MAEVFVWSPQASIQLTREPSVSVVKFGDGYEQRQVKGINSVMDKYSLTFRGVSGMCGRENVAVAAEAFLKARGAVESFYWTPPHTGAPALFVCRSWTLTKNHGLYELTADFEQVPR